MTATPPVDLDALSTADLMARCRDGSHRAWQSLVRRFQSLVYTVARRGGLDDDAAADVFQTCFERLWQRLDELQDDAKVRAWLVTTAKHETWARLRQQRRWVSADTAGDADSGDADVGERWIDRIPDDSPLAEAQLESLQMQHRLRCALAQLDERQRAFAELVFLQDEPLPYEVIAERLNMPQGSIGPTRARLLQRLRKWLEADGAAWPLNAPDAATAPAVSGGSRRAR